MAVADLLSTAAKTAQQQRARWTNTEPISKRSSSAPSLSSQGFGLAASARPLSATSSGSTCSTCNASACVMGVSCDSSWGEDWCGAVWRSAGGWPAMQR